MRFLPTSRLHAGLARARALLARLKGHPRDKYETELAFQRVWAREFRLDETRRKVLEYWRRYRFLDEIVAMCGIRDDTRVLDVGCGISTVLHYIKGHRYGIDPLADEYVKLYEFPDDLDIRRGFGEAIPFPDGEFGVVFCSNVLDHVTDPEQTVRSIHRVLRPGGDFVLIVEVFARKMPRDPAHPHSFARDEVKALVEPQFQVMFERTSPWVGAREYVYGKTTGSNEQFVAVLRRR